MANNVFANNREVSCKSGEGKSICAFPDVCFTPPENPATPPGVPIPYPNTGMDQDTTEGTKTVKITGKEVMLKNKSYFKQSYGDEAGCAAKKGVITSVNRGKVYFKSWSMDVKIEGENVIRHLDLSTHNHASEPGDTPTAPRIDGVAVGAASDELKKRCAEARFKILKKYAALGKELRKYDPVADAKGGFVKHGGLPGLTKPCGHYVKIRQLQRGLKNDLTAFQDECSQSGIKIDRKVDAAANREITVPPGCSRISLS
jgi:hypothetical protein